MSSKAIALDQSWLSRLEGEFEKPYFESLRTFLKKEKSSGKVIYPPGSEIFNALNATHFDDVKVVILGQDPYHGPGQAHGLCFSVRDGVPPPPSLINIFKELQDDIGFTIPRSGDLSSWARQGVLLLNAVLTVEQGRAGSHQNKGWEKFTDAVIRAVNEEKEHVVFLLWGGYARKKGSFIDTQKHQVLQCGHPSPLSANKGYWFGNKHFSKANEYLITHGMKSVDWSLKR